MRAGYTGLWYLRRSETDKQTPAEELYVHVCTFACMCICALTCIYVHLFDCICGGASVCGMHACVCAHIHPHTYMCMRSETRWERQSALLVFLFPSTLLLLQFVTSPSDHVQAPFAPGLCKMLPGTHSGSTHPRCLPAVT